MIHRFRDPRAGDAYVLVLPMVVVGYQVLGDVIVVQQPTSSSVHESVFCQRRFDAEMGHAQPEQWCSRPGSVVSIADRTTTLVL